jgi:integrase
VGHRSNTRITQKIADALTTSRDYEILWDAQNTGLGLRVRAGGRKTWVYRWRVRRRQMIKTLGIYRDGALGEIVMPVAQAREIARAWRVQIDRGADPRPASSSAGATVAGLWASFVDHKRRREGLGEKTLVGYQQHYDAHISNKSYGIASVPIAALSRRDVIRLQREVADQARRRAETRYELAVEADKPAEYLARLEHRLATAGNGAANKVVLTLGSFFSWVVGSGELDASPVDKISPLPTAGRDPDATLDQADALEALALIRRDAVNDGHRDILLLLLLLAQRCADIRDRYWPDVILHDESPLPYLHVEHHKSRRRTKAAKRVPLTPPALAILLERWPDSRLTPRKGSTGWEVVDEETEEVLPMLPASGWSSRLPEATGPIFPGASGDKPLTDVWHAWKAIAEGATRQRVRLSDVHGLRHASASLMLVAGVPEELIQAVLHHSSVAMTRHYVHGTDDALRRLGEMLG